MKYLLYDRDKSTLIMCNSIEDYFNGIAACRWKDVSKIVYHAQRIEALKVHDVMVATFPSSETTVMYQKPIK